MGLQYSTVNLAMRDRNMLKSLMQTIQHTLPATVAWCDEAEAADIVFIDVAIDGGRELFDDFAGRAAQLVLAYSSRRNAEEARRCDVSHPVRSTALMSAVSRAISAADSGQTGTAASSRLVSTASSRANPAMGDTLRLDSATNPALPR